MPSKPIAVTLYVTIAAASAAAQPPAIKPVELEALKASLGAWDAEIEAWPQGLDAPSVKFTGVEVNRAFGDYWIASDFDFESGGQTMSIHSIVGYDLDKNTLVGKIIDHGPYAATMTGDYDAETRTVIWITKAKGFQGEPMRQKTRVTTESPNQRRLVLLAAGDPTASGEASEFVKCMEILYTRRSPSPSASGD